MAFFKFLFYVLLFILIKIGDTVYSAFSSLKNVLVYPLVKLATFFTVSTTKSHKKTYKETKYSPQKVRTIRLTRFNFIKLFSKFIVSILQLFLLIVRFIGKCIVKTVFEIISFLNFLAAIIAFPLHLAFRTSKGKKYHKKSQRIVGVIKNQPSFVFKFKYIALGTMFALIFFFLPAVIFIFISDLPKLSNLSVSFIPKTTKILDRNGNLLFEIYANQNRTIITLNKVPKDLILATIAIEDKDFYKHNGFDLRGIARSLYVDVTKKDLQGGSTITQQLIKSALLTPEPTVSRKLRELVLAFLAEKKYTKNQILELYFNYVPYGGTAWGVEAASNIYFGKDVSKLTLSESSFLAGLPQAPSQYSPFTGDGSSGKRRQKEVLNAMVAQKYITQNQAEKAYMEKLTFNSPQIPIQAPHFVMYVRDLLMKKYGLFEVERGGLQVTTTLDLKTQKMAEEIVSDEVTHDAYLGIGNGAALISNPTNGDILAMVGSKNYFDATNDGNVNLTTSLRQPGSTIKLITYALALSKGYTEGTILDDLPLSISIPGAETYTPVNYDGRFHGKVPLRVAFANSFNIPAVRITQKFGVDELVPFAKQMGISSWGQSDNYGLSITLGAAEVSMLDLATAYGTVANSGSRVDLNPILKVVDSDGNILQERIVNPVPVLDPGVAFIISDILSDNKARSIEFGSNSPLVVANKRVSVKTGTTDQKRDNWTIGYTPNVLVATWVGNNDNTPLSQSLASGITGAAPMWNRIMVNLLQNKQQAPVTVPENVVSKQCYGYTAYFIRGTENQTTCRVLPSITPTTTPAQQ